MADALLATLILLPAVLAFLLKSNAAISFLALCGGFATVTISGGDIKHLIGQTQITSLTSNDISLILLIVPLLLTLLLTFRAMTSRNQRILQIIPALCAGGLLAVIAAPIFSDSLNTNLADSPIWKNMRDAQSYIVGAGLLSSLLLIWSSAFSRSKHLGKKHK